MIHVTVSLIAGSRTTRGIAWLAETTVNGAEYSARSRSSAVHKLARELAAAGIADAPVEVRCEGLRGHMSYRSLHRLAEFTIAESSSTPLRRVRYVEYLPGAAVAGDEDDGGSDVDGQSDTPAGNVAVKASPLSGTCRGCGHSFVPKRSTATFCSGRCRVAAHRAKAAA